MGLLKFAARHVGSALREYRSSLENPSTPLGFPAEWLLDIFNGGKTDSGLRVSEMTALQVSTVTACVNIIGNALASNPLYVYERVVKKGRLGKRIAFDHPLFDLLHSEPNPEMTASTWRKTMQAHALLWGNAYTESERNGKNEIVALWPRNPSRTRPLRLLQAATIEGTVYKKGTLVYETTEEMGDSSAADSDSQENKLGVRRIILAEDMIHLPGLSLDGRLGQPTIQLARQIIGLALATEKYGAKFFGNGARPAGVLEIPGTMEPLALDNLKRSWAESHGGENAHKTAVLEAGVKYQKTGVTPNEGQFLETRLYQQNDIARVFGVPIHMVGDAGKSTGRSTVEQSSIEFALYCLEPWLVTWQHELKRKLFPKMGRTAGQFFPKFDIRRLLWPDAESRSKLYNGGKQWGYLNTNDIREFEDLNPIDGVVGEAYLVQVNMQNAETYLDPDNALPAGGATPAEPKPGKSKAKGKSPKSKKAEKKCVEVYANAYAPMFRDAVGRAINRTKLTQGRCWQIFAPAMTGLAEVIAGENGVESRAAIATEPRAAAADADDAETAAVNKARAEARALAEYFDIEITKFVSDYATKIFERTAEWKAENADAIAATECRSAILAVLRKVYADPTFGEGEDAEASDDE